MHLVFFPSFCRCIAASFWYTTATCRSVEKCETIVKDMYCVTHTRVHVWQTNQGRTQTIMLHSATRGHTLHREHWTNNTSTSSCSQPWAFRYYKNRKMDLNNLKKNYNKLACSLMSHFSHTKKWAWDLTGTVQHSYIQPYVKGPEMKIITVYTYLSSRYRHCIRRHCSKKKKRYCGLDTRMMQKSKVNKNSIGVCLLEHYCLPPITILSLYINDQCSFYGFMTL